MLAKTGVPRSSCMKVKDMYMLLGKMLGIELHSIVCHSQLGTTTLKVYSYSFLLAGFYMI